MFVLSFCLIMRYAVMYLFMVCICMFFVCFVFVVCLPCLCLVAVYTLVAFCCFVFSTWVVDVGGGGAPVFESRIVITTAPNESEQVKQTTNIQIQTINKYITA